MSITLDANLHNREHLSKVMIMKNTSIVVSGVPRSICAFEIYICVSY